MFVYTVVDFTIRCHDRILEVQWDVEGADDPFAIVDSPPDDVCAELETELSDIGTSRLGRGRALKDLSDISDPRIQGLASDILKIPGVEPDTETDRVAFSIRGGEILINTAPGADLAMIEASLVGLLAQFFGATEVALTARTYTMSAVDHRQE